MTVTVTYDFQLLLPFEFLYGPAVGNVDLIGLSNGGFAVVGESSNQSSAIEIYDGTLAQVGARGGFPGEPAITRLTNGNLVIVSESGTARGVLDIVDQEGNSILYGEPFTPAGEARVVDIAALASGNFVAVTAYSRSEDEAQVVNAFLFNGAGTELLSFPVTEEIISSVKPVVAALDDGGFVVAWESNNFDSSVSLRFQIYNANGSPRGNRTPIDSSSTNGMGRMAITATDGGGFAIVYEDDTVSANTDIAIRLFDASGNLLSGGGTLTGPATVDRTPAITRMPDGLLAVSFSYGSVSTVDMETFAGLFNPANGTFLAQRVALMGNPITDNTIDPAIAGFGQGRVALFHRNATDNDVDGEALEAVRTSTGDATGEIFDPSSYRDIQNGGGGSDFLDGGGANDTLNGEAGGDNLFGGAGNDILAGGDGADTALYTGTAAVTVNLLITIAQNTGGAGFDTLTGIENLIGGNGADIFTGNTLANRLDGGVGNDQLAGGGDNDTLIGGAGSDTAVYAEKTQPVVVFLNGATDATVTVGGASEDTVREIENLSGGSGNDSLVGDGQANVFHGNGGNDFLFGASFAAGGAFAAGSGADTLNGGVGDDGLWGGDGVDTMNGGANNDGMSGGAGNDAMNGGDGADFLFGGDFSVTNGSRLPNSGVDTLNGGNGNDALYGFDGNDTINGDAGNDYVEAGEDNDVVNGGAESDTLLGQAGNDTISGGSGFDYLYGGAGADLFSFRESDSYDTVWDFSAPLGDRLRVDPAFGFTSAAQVMAAFTGFTFEGVAYTVLDRPASIDRLTIKGIASSAWVPSMIEIA